MKKVGSLKVAPRAGFLDRAIAMKFLVRGARSIAREISFTFRELLEKIFCELVLIAK
jgi:hypothetical protein